MMYSEFVNGTKCKDNEHNRQVFKNLEVMYMNTEMTKEEIYEYGKKLVDNSKTPEEIEFENEVNARKYELRKEIEERTANAKMYSEWAKSGADKAYWKANAAWERELRRKAKCELDTLNQWFAF